VTATIPEKNSMYQRRSRGAILAFVLACLGVGFYLAAPSIGRATGMAPSMPPWWMGLMFHPGGLVWLEARPEGPEGDGTLVVRVAADNRLGREDLTLDFSDSRLALYAGTVYRPVAPISPLVVAAGTELAETRIVFPAEAGERFRRLYSIRLSMNGEAWNLQGRLFRDRETMDAAVENARRRATMP